jgi:hypothetical protein
MIGFDDGIRVLHFFCEHMVVVDHGEETAVRLKSRPQAVSLP